MPRRPDNPCADCGVMMWRGTGSLGAGVARCIECRRVRPTRTVHVHVCLMCHVVFERHDPKPRKYCTPRCMGQAQQIRPLTDTRVIRTQREHAAPGLSAKRRANLNHKWQKQGRTCAYCTKPATTVDHVVPLVRGGTNYEGNLVPCCKSCNSSKSGALIVEWRTGRRLPRMTKPVTWAPKARVIKPAKPEHDCPVCSTPTSRPKYCTPACMRAANTTFSLERYRVRAGLQEPTGRVILKRVRQKRQTTPKHTKIA